MSSDLVVIAIYDELNPAEGQLAGDGQEALVLPARELVLRAMRKAASAIVEEVTERPVAACLVNNDPALALLAFQLAPAGWRMQPGAGRLPGQERGAN